MKTPETPIENPYDLGDDDTVETGSDAVRYSNMEDMNKDFLELEKKLVDEFTKPENIEKVISAITKDPELYLEFRRAQSWILKSRGREQKENSKNMARFGMNPGNKESAVTPAAPTNEETIVAMVPMMLLGIGSDEGADIEKIGNLKKAHLITLYGKLGFK